MEGGEGGPLYPPLGDLGCLSAHLAQEMKGWDRRGRTEMPTRQPWARPGKMHLVQGSCLHSRCFSDASVRVSFSGVWHLEALARADGPERHLAALWPCPPAWRALTCEGAGLIRGHGPQVAQVALVAHQHDDDVAVGVVPQLLQPALHVLVSQVLGDVIHQQRAHCTTVVPAGTGAGPRREPSQRPWGPPRLCGQWLLGPRGGHQGLEGGVRVLRPRLHSPDSAQEWGGLRRESGIWGQKTPTGSATKRGGGRQ